MTASVAYAVRFVSFDLDYYYGMFVETDDKGRSHHICTIKVQFDSECESLSLLVPFANDINFDQVFTDFEIEYSDIDSIALLEQAILEKLIPHQREIFQFVKIQGIAPSYVLLDSGMFPEE